mgnify:CR=1 FL=1
MKKLVKIYVFVLVFLLFYQPVNADDNYCMEDNGYIYPIFDSKICDETKDIILNQNEFSYVFDFDKSKRAAKLTEYKKNPKKFEAKKEADLVKKLPR